MNDYLYVLFLLVSFCASTVGSICGIGGGVIIKPVLDAFGVLSVSAISFLSGCTVLAMTCYSVVKAGLSKELLVDMKTGTPLAIGAAAGGIIGKNMFQMLSEIFQNKDMVGAVQAGSLLIITLGTLIYTLKKNRIKTRKVHHPLLCGLIGMILGIFSSFLGIGGGPINLVVLFYFFSMDTKTAAQNSLYIILFSQFASVLKTVMTHTVPECSLVLLLLMVSGGILGGMVGRKLNQKISDRLVEHLFIILMAGIILINIYNVYQFMY